MKETDTFLYLSSVLTRNGNIQNEINERIEKASQFYRIRKVLLTRNVNYIFFVFILREYYCMEQSPRQ